MTIFKNANRLPLHVALFLLLWPASLVRADGKLPDCYVLSVGVDHYPNVKQLTGCVNDARNTTAAFRTQQGQRFGKVYAQTLVEDAATRANIQQKLLAFSRQGSPGDFVVLFLSGHGGRKDNNRSWYFLPYDYDSRRQAETELSDRHILSAADLLIQKGKTVAVIIDACFSGQLGITAGDYLSRYQDPSGGGLILMLSSSADQTSAALSSFSPFAKAVADGLTGAADLNHDGKVTLQEINRFSKERTYQLLRQHGRNEKQDSEVLWSPSISANLSMTLTRPLAQFSTTPPRVRQFQEWVGQEQLPGFGVLTFQLHRDGKVLMIDARGTNVGTWQQNGNQITLQFSGGRVVYSGILQGARLSGIARNGRNSWSWSVSTAELAQR